MTIHDWIVLAVAVLGVAHGPTTKPLFNWLFGGKAKP